MATPPPTLHRTSHGFRVSPGACRRECLLTTAGAFGRAVTRGEVVLAGRRTTADRSPTHFQPSAGTRFHVRDDHGYHRHARANRRRGNGRSRRSFQTSNGSPAPRRRSGPARASRRNSGRGRPRRGASKPASRDGVSRLSLRPQRDARRRPTPRVQEFTENVHDVGRESSHVRYGRWRDEGVQFRQTR